MKQPVITLPTINVYAWSQLPDMTKYLYVPGGWNAVPNIGSRVDELKNLYKEAPISTHDVIYQIGTITQTEKEKLEKIVAEQKAFNDENPEKADNVLSNMAKDTPEDYALYLLYVAQFRTQKTESEIDSNKKILNFIESTPEWKFVTNPDLYPYTRKAAYTGYGGATYTLTPITRNESDRDKILNQVYDDNIKTWTWNDVVLNGSKPLLMRQWFDYQLKKAFDFVQQQHIELTKKNEQENKQLIIDKNEEKKAKDNLDEVKDAVKYTATFLQSQTKVLGEKAGQLATLLEKKVKGKSVRTVEQALKAYDKYKLNLNRKINAKDRAAIATALESVEAKKVSEAFTKFSKAMGYVGPVLDTWDIYIEFNKAIKTDNWRPFFVKAQTVALGYGTAWLAGLALTALLANPIGILGYGIIMVSVGVLIDDDFVEKTDKIIGI